jgi:hypothetical protein
LSEFKVISSVKADSVIVLQGADSVAKEVCSLGGAIHRIDTIHGVKISLGEGVAEVWIAKVLGWIICYCIDERHANFL